MLRRRRRRRITDSPTNPVASITRLGSGTVGVARITTLRPSSRYTQNAISPPVIDPAEFQIQHDRTIQRVPDTNYPVTFEICSDEDPSRNDSPSTNAASNVSWSRSLKS
jgi:hypothetical protein